MRGQLSRVNTMEANLKKRIRIKSCVIWSDSRDGIPWAYSSLWSLRPLGIYGGFCLSSLCRISVVFKPTLSLNPQNAISVKCWALLFWNSLRAFVISQNCPIIQWAWSPALRKHDSHKTHLIFTSNLWISSHLLLCLPPPSHENIALFTEWADPAEKRRAARTGSAQGTFNLPPRGGCDGEMGRQRSQLVLLISHIW